MSSKVSRPRISMTVVRAFFRRVSRCSDRQATASMKFLPTRLALSETPIQKRHSGSKHIPRPPSDQWSQRRGIPRRSNWSGFPRRRVDVQDRSRVRLPQNPVHKTRRTIIKNIAEPVSTAPVRPVRPTTPRFPRFPRAPAKVMACSRSALTPVGSRAHRRRSAQVA